MQHAMHKDHSQHGDCCAHKHAHPTVPQKEIKADAEVMYICPMHPQIRQKGPGNCPICGMTLEPLHITSVAAPNAELIDMTRRFWIGLVLTLPVFALEMGGHLFGHAFMLPARVSDWIQF